MKRILSASPFLIGASTLFHYPTVMRRTCFGYSVCLIAYLTTGLISSTVEPVAAASASSSHVEFRLGVDEANHMLIQLPVEYVIESRSPRNVVSLVQLLGSIDGFKPLGEEKMKKYRGNPGSDPYIEATYEFLPKPYANKATWLNPKKEKALFTSRNELTNLSTKLILGTDNRVAQEFFYTSPSGQMFEGRCTRYICRTKTWSSMSPMRLGLVFPTGELRNVESMASSVEKIWNAAIATKTQGVSK